MYVYTSVIFLNFLNDSKLTRKVKAVPLHVKQALSGGILDLSAGGECGQRQALAVLLHRKRPGSWVGHRTGPENLVSTWGRTPYPSEPLYLLRHPVHQISAKTKC
jgi:hypothetical protein